MLAVMKYEEELREGCRSLGVGASNARETRSASRDASVENLRTKNRHSPGAIGPAERDDTRALASPPVSTTALYTQPKGSLACGLLRFPSVSPRLHSPFASRRDHPNSAVQRRHAARLHLPKSTAPGLPRSVGDQGQDQNPPEERPRRNIEASGRGGLAFRPRHDLHLGESS